MTAPFSHPSLFSFAPDFFRTEAFFRTQAFNGSVSRPCTSTRTCRKSGRAIRFMTKQMRALLAFEADMLMGQQRDAIGRHRSVSRITPRQVLLSGLDGIVHLGKRMMARGLGEE